MLEVTHYDRSQQNIKLTACPACGYEYSRNEDRHDHILEDHDPEDFGLSPLGATDEASQGPLFKPVDELPEPHAIPPEKLSDARIRHVRGD